MLYTQYPNAQNASLQCSLNEEPANGFIKKTTSRKF